MARRFTRVAVHAAPALALTPALTPAAGPYRPAAILFLIRDRDCGLIPT